MLLPGLMFSSVSLKSAASYIFSALLQLSVIDSFLQNELVKGRRTGPFPTPPFSNLHTFGVIPKKHQPGKWRLIVDLTSPAGASVNDGIQKDTSVQCMSVDDEINGIMAYGCGMLIAKFDI